MLRHVRPLPAILGPFFWLFPVLNRHVEACPALSSHFQSFPASYSNIQPGPAISSHAKPFPSFPAFSILFFTESALRPIQSVSRDVRTFVCVSVCPVLFTPFKRLFAPTSQSPMSKLFRYSESLGKWKQMVSDLKILAWKWSKIGAQKKVL